MAKSKGIDRGIGQLADIGNIILAADGKLTTAQFNILLGQLSAIRFALNGHISFGDGSNSSIAGNIAGRTKIVSFLNADQDYEVPHDLGQRPIGIIQLYVDTDDAVVRASNDGSWTPTRIFVRCNTAGTTARFVVV